MRLAGGRLTGAPFCHWTLGGAIPELWLHPGGTGSRLGDLAPVHDSQIRGRPFGQRPVRYLSSHPERTVNAGNSEAHPTGTALSGIHGCVREFVEYL